MHVFASVMSSNLHEWTFACAHMQLSRVYLATTLDVTHVYQAVPLLSGESLGTRLDTGLSVAMVIIDDTSDLRYVQVHEL